MIATAILTRFDARTAERSLAMPSSLMLSLLAVLVAVRHAAAVNLPYLPAQILMPTACLDENNNCAGPDTAYIFNSASGGDVHNISFQALDYSNDVNEDVQMKTILAATLPFLKGGSETRTYTAARTANGSVVVYAGDCDGGIGQLWSYEDGGHGWQQVGMETLKTNEVTRGPFFMGGTIAFSSALAPTMDKPTIYTYGGMCSTPATADADHTLWQSSGNYTKTMMSLGPADDDKKDVAYELNVASNGGPRTPMAGFTITGLPPSFSNVSGAVTQQVGYVLLGGHTQSAFINMSTAAVWKLPEESWSYVSIQAPDSQPSGELALKAVTRSTAVDNVYSRSGHSAVLSEDGQSIVVLGGWVGDVNTAAEPQLAVLKMSQAYSGWKWSIPKDQPAGNGVFGHAAAVLPGNVMMVYGGWEIGGGALQRRQNSGSGARFLNLTSMEWGSSYKNPAASSSSGKPGDGDNNSGNSNNQGSGNNGSGDSNDAPDSGSTSSKSIRLGLGLGLGLGIGLLILLIVAVVCFFRIRKKRRVAARDSAIQSLRADAAQFRHGDDDMLEQEGFPWPGSWYTGGQDQYAQGERSLGYESLRGGSGQNQQQALGGSVARKPVPRQGRGGYLPATTSGSIYDRGMIPIMEDDEEESMHHRREPGTPTSEVPSDPFMTPTAGSVSVLAGGAAFNNRASPSPSPEANQKPRRYDPEVEDWVSDADAAETLLASMNPRRGRISPTRRNSNKSAGAAFRDDDSRHGSNLSESSAPSRLSFTGNRRMMNFAGSSGLLAGTTVLAGSDAQKPGSSSSSSYRTAKSAFGTLQAEGPSLLLGAGAGYLAGRTSTSSPEYDDDNDEPGSPSKSKAPRRGWLGSLRRVFSTSGSTTPNSSTRGDSPMREKPSFEHTGDYEVRPGLSGELLRRKQGKFDWDSGDAGDGYDGAKGGSTGEKDDWDIERAVESRLVQVMFSVPKERLRVVNPDERGPDDDGVSVKSARSIVPPAQPSPVAHKADIVDPQRAEEEQQQQDLGLLRVHSDDMYASDDVESHRRRSGLSKVSSDGRSEGRIETAEAVRMERPRTRVLRMVEGFEARSREPSPSPTRDGHPGWL
ncbi:hypothetical protein NLU13_5946 [Sarocladium strictum]|uniref:Galactose oxidase n=1 Tax=Sarocladium strictum TaxID=5046 RepID=A0AA39GGJ7_SARSR|nr:hypothetical protein NLU13_5946 [Sarocladium strictum]